MIIEEDIYLEHFGVRGMRWGVNNPNRFSRSDKIKKNDAKAEDNDAKAEAYQKRINEEKAKTVNYFMRGSHKNKIKDLEKARDNEIATAKARREGKLTPSQKKLAIGAGAAAAILASYGIYKAADTGEFNRLSIKGKAFLTGEEHAWKKDVSLNVRDMDVDTIKSTVVDKINPDYGKFGTKMNCRRATFAYEMRRRGNDVRATRSIKGSNQTAGGLLRAISKDDNETPTSRAGIFAKAAREINEPRSFSVDSKGTASRFRLLDRLPKSTGRNTISSRQGEEMHDSIFRALRSQPDRARGELGVGFRMGGGHSMAWEIVNGNPVVIDGQSGNVYSTANDIRELGTRVGSAGFTRLDNVELNNNFLMRWLTDA